MGSKQSQTVWMEAANGLAYVSLNILLVGNSFWVATVNETQ